MEPTSADALAYDIKQAVRASNGALSRTALYAAAKAGEIEFRKRGKRTFVLADDLRRFLASMPAYKPTTEAA